MTVGAVPLAAGCTATLSAAVEAERFLPFAAGFWQGVPDRVRAKQRGMRRSGNGSRVERSHPPSIEARRIEADVKAMTSAQIAEAQRLAREWVAKK
jgi:hypothetical protein